jgi:hypothetical protein
MRGLDQRPQLSMRQEVMELDPVAELQLASQRLDLAAQSVLTDHIHLEIQAGGGERAEGPEQRSLIFDGIQTGNMEQTRASPFFAPNGTP